MKNIYLGFLLFACSVWTHAFADVPFSYSSHTITVRVFVHDPNGKPVEGASVNLALPRYGRNQSDQRDIQPTNPIGVAIVKGKAEQDYAIFAEKPGYYPTFGPHRDLASAKSVDQYAARTQEVDIELRPILNPVAGIQREFDALLIPELNKPFGFDLEVGDWVTPYGRGNATDLIFQLDGYFKTPDDYSFKLRAVFSHDGDGLQAVTVASEPHHGSAFQLPYEAPLDGYEKVHVWERTHIGKERVMTGEWKGGTEFIFRIRTVLDPSGNVLRALYGHLGGNVDFRGKPEEGYRLSFYYWLNPEWTRSLEADPKKTATSIKP